MVPSSIMTLSPKTLTSIAPLARSTILVRTSLIALLRALISMAQTPKTIDFELEKSLKSSKVSLRTERLDPYFESLESSVKAKSEYEHVEDGEGDLVTTELSAILNGSDIGMSIFWSIQIQFYGNPVFIVTPSPCREPRGCIKSYTIAQCCPSLLCVCRCIMGRMIDTKS